MKTREEILTYCYDCGEGEGDRRVGEFYLLLFIGLYFKLKIVFERKATVTGGVSSVVTKGTKGSLKRKSEKSQ